MKVLLTTVLFYIIVVFTVCSTGLELLPQLRNKEYKLIHHEMLDSIEALNRCQVDRRYTAVEVMESTSLNRKALKVSKPDYTGYFFLQTRPVKVEPETWHAILLDLNTQERMPMASLTIMAVETLANGKKRYQSFSYNDGIQRPTKFGGVNLAPHTLGEWRTTHGIFKTSNETTTLEVRITIGDGAQTILFNNLRILCSGQEQPDVILPVIETRFDEVFGVIRTSSLIPEFVYEIEAVYAAPNHPPPENITPGRVTPLDGRGMCVRLFSTNLAGQESEPLVLQEYSDANMVKSFRFTMPQDAVSARIEFSNDDMYYCTYGDFRKYCRLWRNCRITPYAASGIVNDSAMILARQRPAQSHLHPKEYLSVSAFDLALLQEQLRHRQAEDCTAVNHKGGMAIKLGETLLPPIFHSHIVHFDTADNFSALGKRGSNLLISNYPVGGISLRKDWVPDGNHDFSELDAAIYRTLKQVPDAHIILSLYSLYPPQWWGDQHPDTIVRDQSGLLCWAPGATLYKTHWIPPSEISEFTAKQKIRRFGDKERGVIYAGHYMYSTASSRQRQAVAGFLAGMRRYIEAQPYGKAVIGYRMGWGYDTQWGEIHNDHGYNGPPHYADYSSAMTNRFRAFLRERYQQVDKLRSAWADNSVTFENAGLPGIERRNIDQLEHNQYLLDPAQDRIVIDFRECQSLCVGEMLQEWAQALNNAGKRKVLILSYNPDVLETCTGGAGNQRGNHVIMREPAWHGGGGPSYEAREIGLYGKPNALRSSYPLNHKLHLTEIDHRLFPVASQQYSNNTIFETPEKSINLLRREYATQMCYGTGSWTFDMGVGWFSQPIIADAIKQARDVFLRVLHHDRRSVAKVAIYMSEYGKFVQCDGRRGSIPKTLVSSVHTSVAHAGVALDYFKMDDLPAGTNRYSIYLFPFAYALTAQERQWIESLKCNNSLLVFGYGAGYVGQELSVPNICQLTGMEIRQITEDIPLTMEVTTNHTITAHTRGFIGSSDSVMLEKGMPRFVVSDTQAIPLGYFVTKDASKQVAMALKDHGNWQSLYIGVIGAWPPELIRSMAEFKGVHIYSYDNDAIYCNQSLLSVHANKGGEKNLHLPGNYRITSLWDNLELGVHSTIKRTMKPGESMLYLLESAD